MNYTNLGGKNLRNPIYNHFFWDKILGADLAGMQLISKFKKGIRFLLYVIDIYRKYASVVPLKDEKRNTIINTFQENLDESGHKRNKIWLQGSGFYNRSVKLWFHNNEMEIYSTQCREIYSCISTWKDKIYKHVTAVSKNVYFGKLDKIVNKQNSTYHRTNRMNPASVNSGMYIEYGVKHKDKYQIS